MPLHRFALVRWLNRALIIATLRWLMWREGIRRPVTWFMIPHLSSVVGELGERLSVYYCIDDYAALPDVNPDAVRAMDEELTRKADLVFVASDTLLGPKRELNPEHPRQPPRGRPRTLRPRPGRPHRPSRPMRPTCPGPSSGSSG